MEILDKAKKTAFPGFKSPMLAVLTKDFFDNPDWIFERKLDGVRCLIVKRNDTAELYSRNEKPLNDTYPVLAESTSNLSPKDFIADGEIVAFDGKLTSFSKLQKRMQVKDPEKARNLRPKVYLYLFDMVYYDGYDLTGLPLTERKKLLKDKLSWNDPVRYTPHRRESGKDYHAQACKKGWEGILAKNGNSTYRHLRSRDWLKFKCTNGQQLVIGGFTEPQGERIGFGALLVGFYRDDTLHYAGKVGTGFDDLFLKEWRSNLNRITRRTSPFSNFSDAQNGANFWTDPEYVGQFNFTEWTDDNKLRHPVFVGMRDDKDPKEVTKEP